MANLIENFRSTPFGTPGSLKYTAGGTIAVGDIVARALGGVNVTAAADATPVVGTDYFVGIAESSAVSGEKVSVTPFIPGQVYLLPPKTAASWDTQAEYDALVGKRVVLDLTAGVYTVEATDGATNGLVVMPLDITKNPGRVAFAVRAAVSDLS